VKAVGARRNEIRNRGAKGEEVLDGRMAITSCRDRGSRMVKATATSYSFVATNSDHFGINF